MKTNQQELDAIDKIRQLKKEDWGAVFDLIPRIETTTLFSDVIVKPGQFPYQIEAEIIMEFRQMANRLPLIIPFDWTSWDKGMQIYKDQTFDFDSIDIIDKCRLFTLLIRMDRFSEGVLSEAFRSGQITKILKSLEREIKSQQ